MYKCVLAKFQQHVEIQKILLDTEDAVLVEHTSNDFYWADGGDGSGTTTTSSQHNPPLFLFFTRRFTQPPLNRQKYAGRYPHAGKGHLEESLKKGCPL